MSEPIWKQLPPPAIGSRWDSRLSDETVRVMAVAEGYVMCRFTGATPIIIHLSDWNKRFVLKPLPSPAQEKGR